MANKIKHTPEDANTNELVHIFLTIGCQIPQIIPKASPAIPANNR